MSSLLPPAPLAQSPVPLSRLQIFLGRNLSKKAAFRISDERYYQLNSSTQPTGCSRTSRLCFRVYHDTVWSDQHRTGAQE